MFDVEERWKRGWGSVCKGGVWVAVAGALEGRLRGWREWGGGLGRLVRGGAWGAAGDGCAEGGGRGGGGGGRGRRWHERLLWALEPAKGDAEQIKERRTETVEAEVLNFKATSSLLRFSPSVLVLSSSLVYEHEAPHASTTAAHGSGHENTEVERSHAGLPSAPVAATMALRGLQNSRGNVPLKRVVPPPRPNCFNASRLPKLRGRAPLRAFPSRSRSCSRVSAPRVPGKQPFRLLKSRASTLTRPPPSQPTRSQSH